MRRRPMASQEAAIKSLLTSNGTWTALLTGGTYLWDDLGNQGATPENLQTAGAYHPTTGALRPTAVITFSTEQPHVDIPTIAEERFFSVWLYDQIGFTNIRTA